MYTTFLNSKIKWFFNRRHHAFLEKKNSLASCRPSQEFLHFDIASQTSELKQGRVIPSPSRCYDLRRGSFPQEPRGDISPAVRDGVVERVVSSPVLPREVGSFRKQVPIESEKKAQQIAVASHSTDAKTVVGVELLCHSRGR